MDALVDALGQLGQLGLALDCPVGDAGDPPAAQRDTTEPRLTCRIRQGSASAAVLWVGSTSGGEVLVSAIVG